MTRDEILTMEAGREMDSLIEKLLHPEQTITVDKNAAYQKMPQGYIGLHVIAHYSHDISDAWEVMEKLKADGYPLPSVFTMDEDNLWHAAIRTAGDQGFDDTEANTAPLAICRAALLATLETK